MTNSQLITEIAAENNITKKASKEALEMVFSTISECMLHEEVRVTGFGTFASVERPPRMARNPRTGEPIQVAAKQAPKFTASKALKDKVNGQ